MRTIERTDATDSLGTYAGQTADFPIIVTDHGQPIAALMPIPNTDMETVSLGANPQFLSLIARSRARQEKQGGVSGEGMQHPQVQKTAESPDACIVCLAEQFLDAAKLMLRNTPGVVAPSPIRVNAAFAIELFIKALASHWECTSLDEELGLEDTYAVTTKANVHEHKLSRLFRALPALVRNDISLRFSQHSAWSNHPSLEELVSIYSSVFESERYVFEEHHSLDYESHPLREIVDLAEFFREFIASLPVRRFVVGGSSFHQATASPEGA